MFLHHYNAKGEVLTTYSGADHIIEYQKNLIPREEHFLVTEHDLLPFSYIWEGKVFIRPEAPSKGHFWDWDTRTWKFSFEEALSLKKQALTQEYLERSQRPILFRGSLFDADAKAQDSVLKRLLLKDSIPEDFQWRDFNNQMHPADAVFVESLHQAIQERDYQLKQALWLHQANLSELLLEDQIKNYPTENNWPAL